MKPSLSFVTIVISLTLSITASLAIAEAPNPQTPPSSTQQNIGNPATPNQNPAENQLPSSNRLTPPETIEVQEQPTTLVSSPNAQLLYQTADQQCKNMQDTLQTLIPLVEKSDKEIENLMNSIHTFQQESQPEIGKYQALFNPSEKSSNQPEPQQKVTTEQQTPPQELAQINIELKKLNTLKNKIKDIKLKSLNENLSKAQSIVSNAQKALLTILDPQNDANQQQTIAQTINENLKEIDQIKNIMTTDVKKIQTDSTKVDTQITKIQEYIKQLKDKETKLQIEQANVAEEKTDQKTTQLPQSTEKEKSETQPQALEKKSKIHYFFIKIADGLTSALNWVGNTAHDIKNYLFPPIVKPLTSQQTPNESKNIPEEKKNPA